MPACLRPGRGLGGTFNPVHYGHLRSALELVEHLGLEHLRLMPCAVPPAPGGARCSAATGRQWWNWRWRPSRACVCDRRELQRSGHLLYH